VPRMMSPFRRRAVPQSAPSLMAALGHKPQQAVVGNILPYSRKRAAGIRKPRQEQQQQQQQQAGRAGAPPPQPQPGSSVLKQAAAQQSAAAKPPPRRLPHWCQRLAGAAARVLSAAVRVAMVPVQAARAYVPLGHEVYLVSPVHGHGLHAAILEGMQRSLLCPTAHRMPSHR
jgi:hypothetical protein